MGEKESSLGEIFVWILRVASLTPRILEEILVGGLRRGGEPDGVDPSRLGILDEDLLLRRGGIGGKPGKVSWAEAKRSA